MDPGTKSLRSASPNEAIWPDGSILPEEKGPRACPNLYVNRLRQGARSIKVVDRITPESSLRGTMAISGILDMAQDGSQAFLLRLKKLSLCKPLYKETSASSAD
jgi:hypothetical protein